MGDETSTGSRRRIGPVQIGLLVAALLVAGVISGFASGNPDGLEFVAESTGFADTAGDHAVGHGPLADYTVAGLGDGRLSGGIAGVIGVLVTLALAGGLAWTLSRRDAIKR